MRSDIGSGIIIEPPLHLGLYDYDNQLLKTDSSSQFIITSQDMSKDIIGGTNAEGIKNGIATFDEILATSAPGSSLAKYKVSSKTFDKQKLLDVFGKSSADTEILLSFRYCKPGERQVNNQ